MLLHYSLLVIITTLALCVGTQFPRIKLIRSTYTNSRERIPFDIIEEDVDE